MFHQDVSSRALDVSEELTADYRPTSQLCYRKARGLFSANQGLSQGEAQAIRTLFQTHAKPAVNKERLFVIFDQKFSVFKAHHLKSSLCREPKLNIPLMPLKAP